MSDFTFLDVTRHTNDILYMAYYFPQFHIAPENKIQLKCDNVSYTDWDTVKNVPHSFTPIEYYNLGDQDVFDKQDDFASKYKIGVFIFYHYWLDNKMILNLPVDLFMNKKRKTKFMFCWDNESGCLGQQYYNSPEEHAYQMIRYFKNENYLTDKNGQKPFIIYLTPDFDKSYLDKFINFLSYYDIKLKIGFHFQKYKNNWYIPEYSNIGVEFGPHMEDGHLSGSKASGYHINRKNSFLDYWQGGMSSWDSRPRANSLRTHQNQCNILYPNGCVSVEEFKNQIIKIKNNIASNNKDKIITLFAFNEWSEGAVLEESQEFGTQFIECL